MASDPQWERPEVDEPWNAWCMVFTWNAWDLEYRVPEMQVARYLE